MVAALITPPAFEPVTLAEAKAHLRVETTADDSLIGALITAARVHVETATRRLMITQSWRYFRDDWPDDGVIELGLTPIASVDAVLVYDGAGLPVTLPPSRYQADLASTPARLKLTRTTGSLLPGQALNGIEIDITAGYGPSGVSVPQPLRLAIMMLVARWYEYRDATAIGIVPASIAAGFEALVAPYRVMRLA